MKNMKTLTIPYVQVLLFGPPFGYGTAGKSLVRPSVVQGEHLSVILVELLTPLIGVIPPVAYLEGHL